MIQDIMKDSDVDLASETKSDALETFATDIIDNVMESIVGDQPHVKDSLEASTAKDDNQVTTFLTEIDEFDASLRLENDNDTLQEKLENAIKRSY